MIIDPDYILCIVYALDLALLSLSRRLYWLSSILLLLLLLIHLL